MGAATGCIRPMVVPRCSGGQGQGFPGLVPVAVEVGGSQGGDRGGSVAGPVHAAAFEALGDELFHGRFH